MTRLAGRISICTALVSLCLALGGCDTLTDYVKPAPTTTGSIAPRTTMRLQSGDKVKLVVYGEEKMTGDYDIDSNGSIDVPLLGTVHAVGLTKKDLEKTIVGRLRSSQILLDPIVTVDISTSRPFYVMGEVEKPGEYVYRNGLNVLSAVAVAGGYTYRASKSTVLVKRAGEKGLTEFRLSPDIPIYPGDLISVPERYF